MARALVLFLALLAAAGSAHALSGWSSKHATGTAALVSDVNPGREVWMYVSTADELVDPTGYMLRIDRCTGGVDLTLVGNSLGFDAGVTIGVYTCPTPTWAFGGCSPIYFDTDADGIADTNTLAGDPTNGTNKLYEVLGTYLALTIQNPYDVPGIIGAYCRP